jgi:hypothetical protein
MTIDTLGRVSAQMKYRNYIAPVDDDSFGRELFYHGKRREECQNQAQRAGFDAAARAMIVSEWLEADIRQIAA